MGNTPTHYKRRFSGDVCGRLPNSTPPGVSVTIPPPKKRNTHSLTDLSRSAPADYPNNEMSVNDDNVSPNDKDTISIDEATSMMRAASLREPINIIDAHDNPDDNNRLYNVLPSAKMVTSTISSGDEKISNVLHERPSSAGPLYSTDEQIMYKHSQPQIILNNVSRDRARTLPSRKLVGLKLPTVFRWNGGGKDIYISGTFNNWEKRIPMVKRNSGVYVIIDCKPGIHQYKYFIDGAWYHDPTKKTGSLAQEIQKAREHIKTSLDRVAVSRPFDVGRLDELEKLVTSLVSRISDLESRISTMKLSNDPHDVVGEKSDSEPDLFGSDSEEDKEAERIRSEREAEYLAKKALKPVVAAKSSITLDVKPWDDEVDMEELTSLVKGIKVDGLLWGASKLVPIAFGIKKLQICCVVEDDKVGTDFLEESIKEFSKHVQSVDIVSFNKL